MTCWKKISSRVKYASEKNEKKTGGLIINFDHDHTKDFALFLAPSLILLNTFRFHCLQQKIIMPSQNMSKGRKILKSSLKGLNPSETHKCNTRIPDAI